MVEGKELFYEKKLKDFYNEKATESSCLKLDNRYVTFLMVVSLCGWAIALVFIGNLYLVYTSISEAWYNSSAYVIVGVIGLILAFSTFVYQEYITRIWRPKVKKEIGVLVDYLDDLDVIRIKARLREITKDDLDSFDRQASRLMGDNFANLLNTGMRMECSRVVLHDSSLRKLSKLLDVEIDDKLLCLMSMLKTWSNEKLVNI
jgi:hypothetical protein